MLRVRLLAIAKWQKSALNMNQCVLPLINENSTGESIHLERCTCEASKTTTQLKITRLYVGPSDATNLIVIFV